MALSGIVARIPTRNDAAMRAHVVEREQRTAFVGRAPLTPPTIYERYARQYAAFRLHTCLDDRAEGLAALDLSHARHAAEIGCGPGYYAPMIAARHPTVLVTGIDNSPAQIALARQRAARHGLGNTRFICDDACALSQPDGRFDRIVASRLFMVVRDPRRTMAELSRVLAPGGILVITELIARPAISFAEWAQVATPAERIFTAAAFTTLISSFACGACAIWETGGYRYARCRKAAD
ncbi:MAG: class I SAM-dependent methyltransferase [Chloroflexota bacterium]|nr:class I SAM-dependent methyltransferase [Chloroflexota bacterium]